MRIKAILIDIDGTLANSPKPDEKHLKSNGELHWTTWVKTTQYSPVHQWCYEIVAAMSVLGYSIVYLTSREGSAESKKITEEWLTRNSPVPIYDLYMRDELDKRHDKDQKQDTLINEILPKYDIQFAIDDKKSNIDMFRELGIPALHCANY